MFAYKLTTLIVISLLVAILLASALNSSLRVADSALADLAPVGVNSYSPQPNAPLVSPSKNYLPITMLNTPASVSCIYTTNGIAGADAGVCSGNVTLSLTAGGNISNTAHAFGLRITNSGALGGNSAALLATHDAESGMNPPNPSGVWGDSYANWGVLGTSYANAGVEGISNSYFGVRGVSVAGNGVYGVNNSSGGITPAAPAGVWGDSNDNWGVLGTSNNYVGVVGLSNNSEGVRGFSSNDIGVRGFTNSSGAPGIKGTAPVTGVVGLSTNTSGSNTGVYGYSDNWNGVWGNSNTGSGLAGSSASGTGVYATSSSGYALNADGNATQTRNMGGLVKLMADVATNGQLPNIFRCYNSQLSGSAAYTVPCGITVTTNTGYPYGDINLDVGFQISDRFFSITPRDFGNARHVTFDTGSNTNSIRIKTYNFVGGLDGGFVMVIVY